MAAVHELTDHAAELEGREAAVENPGEAPHEIARPDGSDRRTHSLQPDPTRPGLTTGELPPLPPGRWQLQPRGEGDPPMVGEPREVVVTAAERERAQVRQDRRNLRQLASRLGGRYVDGSSETARAALLADLAQLDLAAVPAERQDRLEPAAGWPWLALAVGLLGGEWLLRRRHGLL